jgi:hypothetical protein
LFSVSWRGSTRRLSLPGDNTRTDDLRRVRNRPAKLGEALGGVEHTFKVRSTSFLARASGACAMVKYDYDIACKTSLNELHKLMRTAYKHDEWLVISPGGDIKVKMGDHVLHCEVVKTSDVEVAISHRWGPTRLVVNGSDFALDWINDIPNAKCWVDCVTHMNDAGLVARTISLMGSVYVSTKVHAIYCISSHSDVLDCVFRGWMFQELSYVRVEDAMADWQDVGLGAWAIRMLGCLDQYDLHDLTVMTGTTKTPDELASDVGALCRYYFNAKGDTALRLRAYVLALSGELDDIDIDIFVRLLIEAGRGVMTRLGQFSRITEYMCIKLCSMLLALSAGGGHRPVESPRYVDTLLNNLNMALYTKESDAKCATTSAYEVYLRSESKPDLLTMCGDFLLSEEYFIIEPKRLETSELLLEVLRKLVSEKKAIQLPSAREPVTNGLISFLSTKAAMRAFYTGSGIIEWDYTQSPEV